MNRKNLLALAGGLLLALTSAHGADQRAASTPGPSSPAGYRTFSGKVVETTNAANYTYVCVDTGTEKLWAAGPQTPVSLGDRVTIPDAMPMPNYHSKTLNRTFPMVYFAGAIQGQGSPRGVASAEATLPPGHPPLPGSSEPKLPPGHPAIGGVANQPTVDLKDIARAKGGKTVQEIYADKSALAGREVVLRAKVVKYNPDIMGKNWLHVRDGTGAEGSNDLTVTTRATAKVGATVLVRGKITTDKDLGFGYRFPIILEDAEVVVE